MSISSKTPIFLQHNDRLLLCGWPLLWARCATGSIFNVAVCSWTGKQINRCWKPNCCLCLKATFPQGSSDISDHPRAERFGNLPLGCLAQNEVSQWGCPGLRSPWRGRASEEEQEGHLELHLSTAASGTALKRGGVVEMHERVLVCVNITVVVCVCGYRPLVCVYSPWLDWL